MTDRDEIVKFYRYDRNAGEFYRRPGSKYSHAVAGKRPVTSVSIGHRRYKVHQAVWLMHNEKLPPVCIDHINRNPSDNRIDNLRAADKKTNAANAKCHAHSSTGLKGAIRDRTRFIAAITVNGKRRILGRFGTADEAHDRYLIEAKRVWGEFASAGAGRSTLLNSGRAAE